MPDKTPLDSNLPDDLLAIESAFRAIPIPESTLDHESILYQAGWAAAMAERDSAAAENTLPRSAKAKPQFWPAVALTFAASTAACLAIIVWGQSVANETTTIAARQPAATDLVKESSAQDQHFNAPSNTPALSTDTKQTQFDSYQSNFAALIGLPQQSINRSRKAQLERWLDEAAEPSQFVTSSTDDDIDFETKTPLTTGSPLPDVL